MSWLKSSIMAKRGVAQGGVGKTHELTEANIFPYSEPLHWATEPYGPDGRYGQYLSYLLVMLPLGWLVVSSLRPRRTAPAVSKAS